MRNSKEKIKNKMWSYINPKAIQDISIVAVAKGINQYYFGVFGRTAEGHISMLQYSVESILLDDPYKEDTLKDLFAKNYFGVKPTEIIIVNYSTNIMRILERNKKEKHIPNIEVWQDGKKVEEMDMDIEQESLLNNTKNIIVKNDNYIMYVLPDMLPDAKFGNVVTMVSAFWFVYMQ